MIDDLIFDLQHDENRSEITINGTNYNKEELANEITELQYQIEIVKDDYKVLEEFNDKQYHNMNKILSKRYSQNIIDNFDISSLELEKAILELQYNYEVLSIRWNWLKEWCQDKHETTGRKIYSQINKIMKESW